MVAVDHRRRLPPTARRRGRRDRRPGDRRPDAAPRRPRRPADLTRDPPHGPSLALREPDEHAVLRLARAADEGPGGLRAQGHRPRPQRRRGPVRRRDRVRRREPVPGAAQDQRDLRPDRLRRGRAATTSSRTSGSPGVRLADMRGYSYDRRDVTGRGLANAYAQTLGTIFSSGGEKPYEVEIFVAEVGDAAGRRPDLPAHLRRPGGRRARLRGHGRLGRAGRPLPRGALRARHGASTTRSGSRWRRSARTKARRARSAAGDLEVAVLDRTRPQQRKFRRLTAAQLAEILGNGDGPAGGADAGPPGGGRPLHRPDTARTTPPTRPTRSAAGHRWRVPRPVSRSRRSRRRWRRSRTSPHVSGLSESRTKVAVPA